MKLSFDAEKFIALIKSKEAIWNYKSNVYNDKDQRRNQWLAVCSEMVDDFYKKTPFAQQAIVTSFQKQWKVLRDGFLRSLKNIKKKGPSAKLYTYHDDLLFMIELYEQDIDTINIITKKSRGDSSDEISEAEPSTDTVPIVKRRIKRSMKKESTVQEVIESKAPSPTPEEALIAKITNYIDNEERNKQNNENDEDKLFLLSLLNDFKNIPNEHKLDAKFDILNVLRHYRDIAGTSSKPSAAKRSRKSSSSNKDTPQIFYVKCENDEFEED